MINMLADRMVVLMRVVNIYGLEGNKLSYELHGMVMAAQAMEIEVDFDFNETVDQYTAVILNGQRYEVAA